MYLVLGYFFFCFIFKMLLPLIKKSSFERLDHLLPTMFMSLIETQLEFQVVRWIDNPKVDSSIDHTIPSFLGCQKYLYVLNEERHWLCNCMFLFRAFLCSQPTTKIKRELSWRRHEHTEVNSVSSLLTFLSYKNLSTELLREKNYKTFPLAGSVSQGN